MTMITMNSAARTWIKQAVENDKQALIDGIITLYNCQDVDVDNEGDVWISNPQSGHWLDEDGLDRIGRALKAGNI